jgi:hypothetical protein
MTPDSALYCVRKRSSSWTLVVASSEEHAKVIAKKLPPEAFCESRAHCSIKQIKTVRAIPDGWKGELPWVDPRREHLYGEPTCEDVVRHAQSQKRATKKFLESP